MFARAVALAALLAGCAAPPVPRPLSDPPASAWAAACEDFDEWDKPGPPFRIFGNTWYVGTCGISAILIVSPDGHTLIDSGTDEGAKVVLANIRRLGFDPRDVVNLLMSHEHIDHTGGMARLQQATGAPLLATAEAIPAMRSGKLSAEDPQAGLHPAFPGVADVREIEPGAILSGDTELHMLATPGHTLGAQSWRWRECEGETCRSIVYLDSLNPISRDGYRFTDRPELVAAMRAALTQIEALDCDILLAPHPSAANLRSRLLGEAPLVDLGGCKAYAATARKRLDDRLAGEAKDG